MEKNDLNITADAVSKRFGEASDYDEDSVVSESVPLHFRGTQDDKHDMLVLGRKQVLRRHFNFFTMLGFSSTVMTAWEILPIVSVFPLEDGGLPIIFWAAVIGAIGLAFVYASLAEVASMLVLPVARESW